MKTCRIFESRKNRARSFDRALTKAFLLFRHIFMLADGNQVVNDQLQKIKICSDLLIKIAAKYGIIYIYQVRTKKADQKRADSRDFF